MTLSQSKALLSAWANYKALSTPANRLVSVEIGFVAQQVIEHDKTLVDVVDTSTDHIDEAFSDLHVMKYQNTTALLLRPSKATTQSKSKNCALNWITMKQ